MAKFKDPNHEYYCQQCNEYFDTLAELNEHDRTNGEFKAE